MNKLTPIFLAALISNVAFAQNDPVTGASLKVLHIKGDISNKTKNKNLNLGDEVLRSDQVEVRQAASSCYFVNEKNNRFVLKSQNTGVYALSENLMQLPPRRMITQRGLSDTSNAFLSPGDLFGNDHFIFLDSIESVKLDKKFFPIEATSQFVVRVFVGDSLYKTYKVKHQAQVVYFKTQDIRPILNSLGEKRWLVKMELNMVDRETGYIKTLCTFKPESFEFVPVRNEIGVLVANCQKANMTPDQILEEVVVYIEDIYGRCNQSVLKGVLNREFKLAIK